MLAHRSLMRFASGLLVGCLGVALPVLCLAETFTDVAASSNLYQPIMYLKEQGIMEGYDDGTFRPNAKVNRAEAVKIITAPLIDDKKLEAAKKLGSSYDDVSDEAWYAPYVELARATFKIIDGPPKSETFSPEKPVLKAQFLKMFLLANDIDAPALYGELKIPLSFDAQGVAEWYYPYMRYSVASSMLMAAQDNSLTPEKELTRGDIALILWRHASYKNGNRTQALLSAASEEISSIASHLEKKRIADAEYASARALIASRGALTIQPDADVVKAAVKTAEGFRNIVLAYKARAAGKHQEVITLTSDAWHLALKAKEFSPALGTVAAQMQTIAKSMADEARSALKP